MRRMAPSGPLERPGWTEFVPRRRGACFMLSHGEESGRDVDEWREAREEDGPHCPVFADEQQEDGDTPHQDKERMKIGGG